MTADDPSAERLYPLLPAVHRLKDAGAGQSLRALTALIGAELQALEADIEDLYDNWFIETCAPWVVPYIGDLLGVRPLAATDATPDGGRAYIANTLRYRCRKGTAAVLEQLAYDVTGWRARAVEFFELLATTQHLNHPRPHNVRTFDLRRTDELELLDGPFDRIAHTLEVRRIASGRGRYNVPNVGLFLWRLQSYPLEKSQARPVAGAPAGRFHVSPLGVEARLFNRPRTGRDIAELAREQHVPGPLRRRPLHDELEARRAPRRRPTISATSPSSPSTATATRSRSRRRRSASATWAMPTIPPPGSGGSPAPPARWRSIRCSAGSRSTRPIRRPRRG